MTRPPIASVTIAVLLVAMASMDAIAQHKAGNATTPKHYDPGKTVTRVANPKHHDATDTVGVVNGTVIAYADFNSMMSGYLKLFIDRTGDHVITDSLYSIIVDSAWDRATEDIIIEQAIQKNHLAMTDSEVLHRILASPPPFLAHQVTDSSGVVHLDALRNALTDPRNDSIASIIIQSERMNYENERLREWIAPKASSEIARNLAFRDWMNKEKAHARIIDKRLAFGFY